MRMEACMAKDRTEGADWRVSGSRRPSRFGGANRDPESS